MTAVLALAGAYLLGAVPFGLIVARAVSGVDPRSAGSGNVGATNVARVAGRWVGAAVLLLDAGKGALAALGGRWVLPDEPWLQVAIGAAAIAGHVFPPFLRFRGGKGVATAAGTLAVLVPWAALVGGLTFAAVFALRRIVSLASLAGVTASLLAALLLHGPGPSSALAAFAFGLILPRHRENIARLRRGEESRF